VVPCCPGAEPGPATVTLLGISGLGCFGIRPEHADQVVAKAAVSSSMQGNAAPLAEADLHAFLAAAT
jgi:hypothetical protein